MPPCQNLAFCHQSVSALKHENDVSTMVYCLQAVGMFHERISLHKSFVYRLSLC